ncbi:MAG: chemotaxis protein CheD [Proteobacteria bacterium]|nr:chemotaxis protein CheD [Pseudomonadota bacterium]
MSEKIKVKIADYKMSSAPDILVSHGLGSCVGISLYDLETKIGALAHILLPSTTSFKDNEHDGKYADRAVKTMFQAMIAKGCTKEKIVAKVTGGAAMFQNNFNVNGQKLVGERNVEAVIEELELLCIEMVASDTGGNHGRTIELDLENGEMSIKSLRHGNIVI